MEAGGGRALAIPVDTADAGEVERAADRVERELGPIDVWVNVAFTSVFAPFTQITPEEYRRVTEVSYLGFVNGTRAALTRMRERDRGAIVQVGSALAYRGIPLQTAYCGAKHAIQGFHEALRCELLHENSNVHVTMVQMPAVNTPQFSWVLSRLPRHAQPVPPIYQPEVAARAVVYAGDHPRRREYWVGGTTLGTLMANAIAPGLLDRYLAPHGLRRTADLRAAAGGRLLQPLGSQWTEPTGATTERTARSTIARTRAASSSGPPSTTGSWGSPRSRRGLPPRGACGDEPSRGADGRRPRVAHLAGTGRATAGRAIRPSQSPGDAASRRPPHGPGRHRSVEPVAAPGAPGRGDRRSPCVHGRDAWRPRQTATSSRFHRRLRRRGLRGGRRPTIAPPGHDAWIADGQVTSTLAPESSAPGLTSHARSRRCAPTSSAVAVPEPTTQRSSATPAVAARWPGGR